MALAASIFLFNHHSSHYVPTFVTSTLSHPFSPLPRHNVRRDPYGRPWFIIPNDVPNVTEESKDTYWPNLVASINNNDIEFKDIAVECVVCRTNVTIYPKDHVVDEEVGESHRAVILPCGHIFGASCVKKFFDIKQREGARASCIKCRAACYHPHPTCMAFTPHVVGKGGQIDDCCKMCSIKRAIADVTTELNRTSNLPEPLREFFGVVISFGGKNYTTCRVEMERLQEIYFPEPVGSLLDEYLERREKKEDSQGYWMSGLLSHCNVKLYVLAPQN
ncbi:uncharacterized protein BKA55DRAFT_690778 [Fusarium redolens]|uniref:RING-type domain-containing protein n=1 Tax=Fusarium redolens TaxID=48865 RepID=A0A9P9H085_FUSRE|nr:uncharacterized protein BKA55DRAFT_690778 [Fusarium redolens]KAH7248665.1 hypothetical protein BKA55DRAFT_690778 [Fusarium redolens]